MNPFTTNFSLQSKSKEREPELTAFWEKQNVFHIRNSQNKGPEFVLHDGPPYANGDIHLGHLLNKTLKDVIVKHRLLKGYKVNYRPGWDCHGLPTELAVQKSKPDNLLQACRDFADKWAKVQENTFRSFGFFADWENPYKTHDKEYEVRQLEAFHVLYSKGLFYRAEKPVLFSPSTRTVLANAELEYRTITTKSAYVFFPVKNSEYSLMAWTSQPWTLYGNVAVCVHPDKPYALAEFQGRKVIVSKYFADKNNLPYRGMYVGRELDGMQYSNGKVVYDDFVGDDGTGLVHLAPSHGPDDFRVCKKFKLPCKTVDVLRVEELNRQAETDFDLLLEDYSMSYPHDWRTGKLVYYTLSKQWFLKLPELKYSLEKSKQVDFRGFRQRFENFLDRKEWCVSRQRKWGFPLPVLYKDDKPYSFLPKKYRESGSAYWDLPVEELLPAPYSPSEFTKSTDTLDVWLDSGLSWFCALNGRKADLYFEGSDQHRGWFQSSFLTSLLITGEPPFKTVLTHGFVLDEHGRKMSKSLGNVISPQQLRDKYNADVLRLWCLSTDYTQDVSVKSSSFESAAGAYLKFRNTFRYFLGHLHDYNGQTPELTERDVTVLENLQSLKDELDKYYSNYEFTNVFSTLVKYFHNLSETYLDLETKTYLYEYDANSLGRRRIQFVFTQLLNTLSIIMAPATPYLCEDVNLQRSDKSVFFSQW